MNIKIGCSGFYYKEWKEIFYPNGLPQKAWFEYYCQHFNTIEINSSFYKLPSLSTLEKWYDLSLPDFLFSIKVPRLITHYRRLNAAEELISDFYALIKAGLREKLGCVLFQMPPTFSYSEERLNLVLLNLDPAFNNVVEFRHESWWIEPVFDALAAKKITFSGVSFPSSIPDHIVQNTAVLYYRFHGRPVLFKSLYPLEEIKDFADELKHLDGSAYIYFNNTWGTAALTNSRQLIDLTTDLEK
ncbi:DUF72 domain-containing protein [Pedobacter metabolipauper]|uniref:Uncharacterized protein YecE (DUF72 family) n=1 Tax=Pedobacter metabolipauper TaxID=425513 RepID=A0A4V3D106_9SPHI|nr:DUF72 domain-containing protein [Pedobacter metabolipauper]TDQ08524.1 uncharacterized protein YecE (DUF72 family) [Pedobacter metabolipauper]